LLAAFVKNEEIAIFSLREKCKSFNIESVRAERKKKQFGKLPLVPFNFFHSFI